MVLDFNMIISLKENKGWSKKLEQEFERFQNMIDSMKLVVWEITNGMYTWEKDIGGKHMVASRLDILLVLEELILQVIFLEANILYSSGLDHWRVTLVSHIASTPKNRAFRLEGFWLDHPNFVDKVKQWW